MLCASKRRRIAAYFVAISMVLFAPPVAVWPAQPPAAAEPAVVSIAVTGGQAWVGEAAVVSGANLYSGELVRLDAAATATLRVPGGLALVAAGSAFRVEPGGLHLEHGKVQLRQDVASPFAIESNLFQARTSVRSNSPARAEFLATESGARVTSLAGVVELTATGSATTYRIHPGESALLGDQVAQAASANTSAGQVTRLVSPVEMDRGSQQLTAAPQSPVFWNDLLHSGRSGRARVTLNDGSILSLGSDSSMRVLQHDAASQQTVLDLAAGRMRGQVVKLTRPGSKFEIRTPTAVAGLVGTDFYLYATPDYTELIVFEGIVRLTNLATGQAIDVTAGMKIIMHRSGPNDGPTQATPREVAQAQATTNVPEIQVAQGFLGKYGGIVIVAAEAGAVVGLSAGLPSQAPISPFRLPQPSNKPQ